MKVENWLYFRTVADEADDVGAYNITALKSICIPASSVKQITPAGTTRIRISFDPIAFDDHSHSGKGQRFNGRDHVFINVTAGKIFEVIQVLAEAVSAEAKNKDGFIVVADDVTTTIADKTVQATYLHPDITSCENINVYKTEQGAGMHEYYEVVQPVGGTTDSTNDVVASLSISLPNDCILIESAMSVVAQATNNVGLVALEVHTAALANDVASDGTEILGADAGDKSIPDADLDIGSSGDTVGDGIHSGTFVPLDRGNNNSFFHVTAKEDMVDMTGAPKVGVYIKWWGPPAVALDA